MEITLLHREQIDRVKWDARVTVSGNGLPYALSKYLDLVTDGSWSALVQGDYESIFPIPFEIKMGLKMYLQPPFTQQLGLISDDKSVKLLSAFLNAIPRNFVTLLLKGNECNEISNHAAVTVKERSNYLLDLNADYDLLFSNFSKSLRKRIRKGKAHYEIIESTDVNKLVDFYQEEMQLRVGLNIGHYATAKKLFKYLIETGIGKIYIAKNEGEFDGALLIMKYQNRVINLFGTSNSVGKKNFAMHLILDHIIEQNASTNTVFDFEGSDLKGVKEFYQSFGSERVIYPEYFSERLPLWYKILRKIKSLV